MSRKIIHIIGWLFLLPIAEADCPDLSGAQPARLLQTEQQQKMTAELLSDWKSDEPLRIVKLGGYILETGKLQDLCCISSTFGISPGAQRLLNRRLERLKFEPANSGGKNFKVFVGLTVLGKKTDSGIQTALLLNHLYSIDEFGIDYSAPQRLWVQSMWSGQRMQSGSVYVEIEAMVDETGQATNGTVRDQEKRGSGIDGALASRIESACFIPGFFENKPTKMRYVEAMSNF